MPQAEISLYVSLEPVNLAKSIAKLYMKKHKKGKKKANPDCVKVRTAKVVTKFLYAVQKCHQQQQLLARL